jgi:hemoglobin
MAIVKYSLLAFYLASLTATASTASLYDRLGGADGVGAIAATLVERVAADPKIGTSFKGVRLDRVKRLLAEQLCELSGGPCHYSGDTMRQVHAGHHISQAEFYGMVNTLREILSERHVSTGATNELLRLLAPMKRDVVEPAAAISEGKPAGTTPKGTPKGTQ